MKVLLPHPDSPTRAQDSPGLTVKFSPLSTKSSFLVGYLNQTSTNSILPTILLKLSLVFYLVLSVLLSSSTASIVEG